MFIKQFNTGGDRNFGYLAACRTSLSAAVIDPSFSPEMIVEFARENKYSIKYIFNTHGHFDHTNGNEKIESMTGIRPLRLGDVDPRSGKTVDDNVVFDLGEIQIKIIHTPGHTSDSICFLIGDALVTGDTLFVGKVGGTDFGKQAEDEYRSLHEKLMILPDVTRVFPGHDYGTAPESTILKEKNTNPFLLRSDIGSFIELKRNWLEYKRLHGIS
ncbi:MAG: MBL fold metallo-hydrolase [bacterium]|nr:MBL fold metallo-hydrolase [bacterium]